MDNVLFIFGRLAFNFGSHFGGCTAITEHLQWALLSWTRKQPPLFVKDPGSNLGSHVWSMLPIQYTSDGLSAAPFEPSESASKIV